MKPAMKVEDLCVDLVTRRQKKRIVDHVKFEGLSRRMSGNPGGIGKWKKHVIKSGTGTSG